MRKIMKFAFVLCFVVTCVCFGTALCGITADAMNVEVEDNDSYEKANAVDVNGVILGNLSTSGDADYYSMQPTANGKLTLSFQHTYQEKNAGWRVFVYLYESGECKVLSRTDISLYHNENITLPSVGAKVAKYYIMVDRDYGDIDGIDYTIKTSYVATEAYEKEKNDAYLSATNLPLGGTVSGNLSTRDDADYYSMQPTANGKLTLSFQHTYQEKNAGWRVFVYLYESGEYKVLSRTDISLYHNENITLPSVGAKMAKYYIMVDRDYGDIDGIDYTIKTSYVVTESYEKEANNTYLSATNLPLGGTVSGNLSTSDDKDCYTFTPTFTGYYKIKFKHNILEKNSGWRVGVYLYAGGEYKQLSNTTVSIGKTASVSLPSVGMLAGSKYYVVVDRSYGELIGNEYSLNVSLTAGGPSMIATKPTKKAIKLSWVSAGSVKGYEVYYRIGKFGKYKLYKVTKKTSIKFTKAKKKKTYYFKVRGYITYGGKNYYSTFSKAKSAKLKKNKR